MCRGGGWTRFSSFSCKLFLFKTHFSINASLIPFASLKWNSEVNNEQCLFTDVWILSQRKKNMDSKLRWFFVVVCLLKKKEEDMNTSTVYIKILKLKRSKFLICLFDILVYMCMCVRVFVYVEFVCACKRACAFSRFGCVWECHIRSDEWRNKRKGRDFVNI